MLKLISICWLALCSSICCAQTKQGEAGPCPDQRAWAGRYSNPKLGFAFTIPKGLKAYWNSARCVPEGKDSCVCMTDFGRDIPLSEDSLISMTGSWEIDSDWSTLDLERNELKHLSENKRLTEIKVLRSQWFKLQTLSTRRFAVQFTESGKPIINEYIVGIKKGVYYYLELRTTPEHLLKDKQVFEKVIASWRKIPRR